MWRILTKTVNSNLLDYYLRLLNSYVKIKNIFREIFAILHARSNIFHTYLPSKRLRTLIRTTRWGIVDPSNSNHLCITLLFTELSAYILPFSYTFRKRNERFAIIKLSHYFTFLYIYIYIDKINYREKPQQYPDIFLRENDTINFSLAKKSYIHTFLPIKRCSATIGKN